MVLNNYGIHAKIITDNRSIFKDNDIVNKTNFRITCDMLGIELKTTSVAQTNLEHFKIDYLQSLISIILMT